MNRSSVCKFLSNFAQLLVVVDDSKARCHVGFSMGVCLFLIIVPVVQRSGGATRLLFARNPLGLTQGCVSYYCGYISFIQLYKRLVRVHR